MAQSILRHERQEEPAMKTRAEAVTGIVVRSVAAVLCLYGIVFALRTIVPYGQMLDHFNYDMMEHAFSRVFPEVVFIVCGLVLYRLESRVTRWIVKPEHSSPGDG